MTNAMRQKLAREPLEEKPKKLSQMIRLAKSIPQKAQETKTSALKPGDRKEQGSLLMSAIAKREVLAFFYDEEERIVEPQTYGMSKAGREVLRARQIGGGSRSGESQIAKLFDVEKISNLKRTGGHFAEALPQHNPNDSAMAEVFASLPRRRRSKRLG